MAFVLELETSFTQKYIKNYIVTIIRRFGINAKLTQTPSKIICAFTSEHEKLQECLEAIAQELPASLFLRGSKSYETDEEIESLPEIENEFPLNLGLCPSCQKEMFEVSSRRYYYPFSSCSCCGGNHSFVTAYPYKRENSSFKFITPCHVCQEEEQSVGLKETHAINSCHECGVPVRLVNKTTQRYANDAGSFRTMFEVAAKAINDDKKLLMKTTFGYRLLYKTNQMQKNSILMMINASKITDYLSLIAEEFQALLSLERPVLNVTIKDERLKKQLASTSSYTKYPDDGFSILLGAELQKLGVDFIAYEEADESYEADLLMDYDLEVRSQSDMRVFLNKDDVFIAEGERVSFPSHRFQEKSLLSIVHNNVGLPYKKRMLFDSMEKFYSTRVDKVNVIEGTTEQFHSRQFSFMQDKASFMSVIAEHNAFGSRCIGAYFEEIPSFLYYDGKNVIRIVPPKDFNASSLIGDISKLREGSDRLIVNLQEKMPNVYANLLALEKQEDAKLFDAVAILLGLNDRSMKGVVKEAMKFVGKGGIQIDTHVKDNRFDNIAFLASIISYQLGGVSNTILSYSIFESFGDYFSEIIGELKAKTKAEEIILCGTHFANQSLFSRMQRNLKLTPPLMNINYPIGKENSVVGGIFF